MNRRSATAERAVKATVSRQAALWWPGLIWIVLWLISGGAHLLFTYVFPEYLYWAAVFLTLMIAGMTLVAGGIAWKRRRRTSWDVPFATATTLLTGLWVVSALKVGPLAPPLAVSHLIVGMPVVVLWMMRMVMERRDAESEANGLTVTRGNVAEQFVGVAAGIAGHRAEITEANPNYIDTTVNLVESDASIRDLQGAADKMAGAAGLPSGAVRFTPAGDKAEQVRMRMVLQDTLEERLPWPGPRHLGGTPFDPYVTGRYEDGPIAVKYVADEAGARNQGTFGMTRSGKGNGARLEVAQHITRREVSVTVVDTVKGIQTFGPLAKGLDWFILDIPQARALFRRLMDVVRARANHLGARRLDAWQPGCGLQFWPLQIEEASHLDVPADEAADVAKACLGVGVRLVWSIQSAQHTQMPITLRRQLTQLQVYGVNDDFDQDTLPDEVTAGGLSLPNQWMADFPGRNMLIDKGLPMERKQTPLRDFETNVAQLEAIAERWGSQPLDKVTADVLGDLYRNRQRPADMVIAIRAASLNDTSSPVTAADPRGEEDDDGSDGIDPDLRRELEMNITAQDAAPEIQIEREALGRPLPPMQGEDMPIGPPPPAGSRGYVPTEEHTMRIRAIVAERIADVERAGGRHVAPPLFQDLVGPSSPNTRSRGWFRKELERLERLGRLKFDPYERKYEIQPDPAGVTTVR